MLFKLGFEVEFRIGDLIRYLPEGEAVYSLGRPSKLTNEVWVEPWLVLGRVYSGGHETLWKLLNWKLFFQ